MVPEGLSGLLLALLACLLPAGLIWVRVRHTRKSPPTSLFTWQSALPAARERLAAILSRQTAAAGTRERDKAFIEGRIEEYRCQLTHLAQELDNVRRYHRLTLMHLPVAVCSTDCTMEIQMWSLKMEQLTAIPGDRAVGITLDQLLMPWGQVLSDFAADTGIAQKKIHLDTPKRHYWLSLHKASIQDHELLTHSGLALMIEDQTEIQILETQLIHSERLASIGRLAAGVAHEIGNPVTGIACLAQDIKLETTRPDLQEMAKMILDQTRRITRIVQSLVNFAHQGSSVSKNPVTIHALVKEAAELLSLSKKNPETRFINRCDPSLKVQGDEQRLLQVFINLLSNAQDASPPQGKVTIDTRTEKYQVSIRITDEGSGIPPELQERLFEPFYTTKSPGDGTGLGLSLVYNIIEEHAGGIDVTSPVDKNLDRGTCFSVTLPLFNSPLATGVA
jgi:signal transduction histidine kinase